MYFSSLLDVDQFSSKHTQDVTNNSQSKEMVNRTWQIWTTATFCWLNLWNYPLIVHVINKNLTHYTYPVMSEVNYNLILQSISTIRQVQIKKLIFNSVNFSLQIHSNNFHISFFHKICSFPLFRSPIQTSILITSTS